MRRLLIFTCSFFLCWSAWPVSANNAWDGFHWARTANPFTLKVGDNLTGDWPGHLDTADDDWTASDVLDATVVAGTITDVSSCIPPKGRVEVCNDEYGESGWLGLARIWVKKDGSGHIKKGQVLLNDTYFNTGTYDDLDARLHVVCQEVGHTIGLDHQKGPKNKSCMNDMFGLFSADYAHPNQHDYDQLGAIYAHVDSITTVGAADSAPRVRVGAHALVVTFITWA